MTHKTPAVEVAKYLFRSGEHLTVTTGDRLCFVYYFQAILHLFTF